MLFSKEDLKRLMIPLLLEQLLAVTIGMMDTVMVSACGEAAVSGVSLVDSINILLINVFSALATGGAVVTAQYLGKRERDNAGRAAKQLFYVILLASCTIMALCLIFRVRLLDIVYGHTDADVMANARTYFLWSAISYPFLAMYNASAALLRSMGDTKTSLKTSLVMNVLNVGGNAILIFTCGLGVAGAAIATLISRMVGAACMQAALRNPHSMIPYPRLMQLEWRGDMARKILAVGLPNGLEGGMFQLGKLVLLRLVSTFGTVSIAANAVGNSLTTLQVLPGSAIGLGMITVVGRCVGAREFQQARRYVRRLMLLAYACMGALNVLMLLASAWLVIPYNLTPETAGLAREIIIVHGLGCITLWPMSFVLPNALRAAGDARFTMIVSILSMAVFRVVSGYVLSAVLGMGVVGVWWAMHIDWFFRSAMFLWRFHGGKWETKVLV